MCDKIHTLQSDSRHTAATAVVVLFKITLPCSALLTILYCSLLRNKQVQLSPKTEQSNLTIANKHKTQSWCWWLIFGIQWSLREINILTWWWPLTIFTQRHHAQGGKLNCGAAVFQIASCTKITKLTNHYHFTTSDQQLKRQWMVEVWQNSTFDVPLASARQQQAFKHSNTS